MAEWLTQCGIRTVALQSTGVYWIAVYDILEAAGLEVYLVNCARDQESAEEPSSMTHNTANSKSLLSNEKPPS